MSNKESLDPRVRRTKKWLQEALLSLMLQKPFTKISIAEITDKAEVSRPTFYLHYKNKEEVLEDYLDSIIQGKMAVKFFEQIADQAVFLRSLIDSEVSNLVMNKLHKYCYDVIKQALDQAPYSSIEDTIWDYVIASIAGSVYAMSIRWLQMDMPHTPKEMGDLTMRLIRPGIREVLTLGGE